MMKGLYGNAYGTLLANVENLTPAAQGGGLSPLQLSRWTGTSEFATMSTMNTPPVNASPTVPYPGQPQYGLQQGPNYARVTSYGGAYGANIYADTAAGWEGSGGWKYSFVFSSGVVEAKAPDGSILTLRPGTKGYKAVLLEGQEIWEKDPDYNPLKKATGAFTEWLREAYVRPETLTPPRVGGPPVTRTPTPPAASASNTSTDVPPPAEGMDLTTKIALGVLAVSVVGGAAFFFLRRGKKV